MAKAGKPVDFIETMDCLAVPRIPEGPEWIYEIKLDGYRLEVLRASGKTTLFSRRENVLNKKFPYIAAALDFLPDGTIVDGELVALDPMGRPNFNMLQNFRSAEAHIHYYAFDILFHKNKDLTGLPLSKRREILQSVIKQGDHIDLSGTSTSAKDMLSFVKKVGLEGVIAKRADSVYQPGRRTGLWSKYRLNLDQEFVIGGYIPSNLGLDSIVIGFYEGKDLYYAARVRAGFVPATRRQIFTQIRHLETKKCPFVIDPTLRGAASAIDLTALMRRVQQFFAVGADSA
jgi:bifunctional non-homologous end joining protein LigD